ncbi:MAG TPA: nitroreductase family deazaflavin-dependent oxidoreductase [Mycobacterium sp.]|jgi:deazaflavin-dependent oxidoreductase (nitroreductase family)
MQLPQWLARFNRHVTNPIQRLWAGWAPTFCILEHVGRKSGNIYRTPLSVFSTDNGIAILLTYGPDRDWLKNLTTAGKARVRRYGRTFTVTDPRVMPKAEAAPAVTGLWRPIFSRLPFEYAVLLRRAD